MINKELHEAFGHCWHELIPNPAYTPYGQEPRFICYKCGYKTDCKESNPDYVADPRLVIREMEKREDYEGFLIFLWYKYESKVSYLFGIMQDIFQLIAMDTTGKLATLALDWLKGDG